VDGIVIVVSILLAFGIDAWWDRRAALGQTREHLQAVRFEVVENIGLLDEQAERCEENRAATKGLLSLIGPDPEPVPPDSLVSLMAGALSAGIANRVSTTALAAMIAEGQFAAIRSGQLRRGLADWLSAVDQRIQQRENARVQLRQTVAYVQTVMPYGLVAARYANAQLPQESRFRLDVGRVLRDATLEGSLSQLSLWRNAICNYDSERREQLEALLPLLDAELAR